MSKSRGQSRGIQILFLQSGPTVPGAGTQEWIGSQPRQERPMNTIQTTVHSERDAHTWSGWPGLGTPLIRKDISSWLVITSATHNYCYVVSPTKLGCRSPKNQGYIARGHAHHSLEMGRIDADNWPGRYSSSRSGMSKDTEMGNPRWQEGNRSRSAWQEPDGDWA